MARRKHSSAASANHRRNKNKNISSYKQHQDLEDKFARMSITPSKRIPSVKPTHKPKHVSKLERRCKPRHCRFTEAVLSYIKRNPPVKPTPKIIQDAAIDLERRRLEPLVPPVIYDILQDIIVWIGLADTHKDDFYYELQLKGLEATVHKTASAFPSHMPRDWKYDRATVGKWGRIPDYFTACAYTTSAYAFLLYAWSC